MPSALITDAGRGSALAFIRVLGRRGWHITAASDERLVPSFVSRHVADRVRHPRLVEQYPAAAEALVAAVCDRAPDLVVPVTDLAIHALRSGRDRLPGATRVAVAGDAALEVTQDKSATLAMARRLGVPMPPTERAGSAADAGRIGRAMAGPYVVKPERSVTLTGSEAIARRVAFASDAAELERVLADCGPALVQPWVPGVGVGVELLMQDGRPLAALQHRRIRETPWTGGASSSRMTEALDPTLLRYASAMLGELGWTGLVMVEFRVGPDGPVLMEINGRVWGSLPLAVRAGMDFPGMLADLVMDGRAPGARLVTGYRVGVVSRDLEQERQWVAGAWNATAPFHGPVPPRRVDAVRVGLRLLDPRGHDAADWRDPAPAALTLVKTVLTAVRSVPAAP